jgi:hypothetical protein
MIPATATRTLLNRGRNSTPAVNLDSVNADESLVCDERSGVRPAVMVDRKLNRLMKNAPLLVSHLRHNCLVIERS